MTRRILVRLGLLATAALLLLNVTSCVLARTCDNGELCTVPLPGATRVVDSGTAEDLPIWTPGIGFAEKGLAVFYADSPPARESRWLPFVYRVNYGGPFAVLSIAYWPPLVLIGLPSLLSAARSRRQRRHRLAKGLCLHCGYDLTGKISGLCSECGKSVQPDPPPVVDKVLARFRRYRRPLKWYGLLLSLLIIAALTASHWIFIRHDGWPFDTYLWDACIYAHLTEEGASIEASGWTFRQRPPFDYSKDRALLELAPFCAIPAGLTIYLWLLDVLRPLPGECPGCGYPLARVTSGACPECGSTVPTSPPPPSADAT